MHLEDLEVTENIIENPFKFLKSNLSNEIKTRFGSGFYPAVVSHLQSFMHGQTDSLTGKGKLESWSTVFDKFIG
jgi:hypothetical protein